MQKKSTIKLILNAVKKYLTFKNQKMNYKKNNIEINLCDQLRDFGYFTKDPYFVFEKKTL